MLLQFEHRYLTVRNLERCTLSISSLTYYCLHILYKRKKLNIYEKFLQKIKFTSAICKCESCSAALNDYLWWNWRGVKVNGEPLHNRSDNQKSWNNGLSQTITVYHQNNWEIGTAEIKSKNNCIFVNAVRSTN